MTSKEKCSLNPGDCAHLVQQHVWMEGGSNEADLEPIMKKLTKDGENRRVPRQYLRSFGRQQYRRMISHRPNSFADDELDHTTF